MWHDGWMHGMGFGWGWIFFAIALVVIVWALVRSGRSGDARAQPPSRESAREVLDARFARGEIDEKEYFERRSALDRR